MRVDLFRLCVGDGRCSHEWSQQSRTSVVSYSVSSLSVSVPTTGICSDAEALTDGFASFD